MALFGGNWKEDNSFQDEYREITGDESVLSKEEMINRLKKIDHETIRCVARANSLIADIEKSINTES